MMSGGSFNYFFNDIQDTYQGELHDEALENLLVDFCKVLHDLEWWISGDIGEKNYQKTVNDFKTKWFGIAETNARWECGSHYKGNGGYCSKCKHDMPIFMNDWKHVYTKTNYCPNCGAFMQVSEELTQTEVVEGLRDLLNNLENLDDDENKTIATAIKLLGGETNDK
jgi:hypothetical protein